MKPVEVKRLRKRLGLSQARLAKQLGVNRVAVAFWEGGTRQPSRMAVHFMRLLASLHERGIEYAEEEGSTGDLPSGK